jgi:CDP-paratose 2-epimerase
MPPILLITGSSGLIGFEVVRYFGTELNYKVHGVDNNQRAIFFGVQGDTRWNQEQLVREVPGFVSIIPWTSRRLRSASSAIFSAGNPER